MTKKHYEAIAKVIAKELEDAPDKNATIAIKYVAHGLAYEFIKDNPKFNRSKFLQACNAQ